MDFELTQHIKKIYDYATIEGDIDKPHTKTYLTELQDIKNYKMS